jgi:predicted ATPase
VRRGFTKPLFSPVPLQAQMLISEDEIATYVANDRDLEGAISFYLERILDKNFQVRPTLGTANFFLQTSDRNTGFVCDLVNDGFGTNTLVYLLAKALRKQQSLICIEEPEIHIHPSALIRLIRVLVRIARETDRKFILSTHSEHLVVELLNSVAKGDITKDEVCIYYLTKDKSKTLVERQEITAKGQIEGGLKAFYQTELEQMRDFIRVHEG